MKSISNKGGDIDSQTNVCVCDCVCACVVCSHPRETRHTLTLTCSTQSQTRPPLWLSRSALHDDYIVHADLCGVRQHTSLLLTQWECREPDGVRVLTSGSSPPEGSLHWEDKHRTDRPLVHANRGLPLHITGPLPNVNRATFRCAVQLQCYIGCLVFPGLLLL